MDPLWEIVSTRKSSKCMRIINIWNLSSLKIQIVTNGLTATGDDTEGFAPSLLANNGPIELTYRKNPDSKKRKERKGHVRSTSTALGLCAPYVRGDSVLVSDPLPGRFLA